MNTIEKIETSKNYIKSVKISKKIQNIISEVFKDKINKNHEQFFIDFIFGYLKKKPKALKEDIEYAVDLAIFYKSKPERFDFKNLKPFSIGENYEKIAEIYKKYTSEKSKSEIQKAKCKGVLISGVSPIVKHKDEIYTVYFVPGLPTIYSPEQLDIQHLLYCYLGKDTAWCTANPNGDYYSRYACNDIYVVYKHDKPHLQFNIVKNKIVQMMNVNDEEERVLNFKLIDILEKVLNS